LYATLYGLVGEAVRKKIGIVEKVKRADQEMPWFPGNFT